MRIGPKYKIARRLGEPVFPKTQTTKFVLSESRKKAASAKLKKRPRARSEYGVKLLEKQKVRYSYGINERKLSNYVEIARRNRKEPPQGALYSLLERRLDNVIFRLGLVPSRLFARQIVTHGHMLVNGKSVSSPSLELRVGDRVSVRPGSKGKGPFKDVVERLANYNFPKWLKFDVSAMEGEVVALPVVSDEGNLSWASVLEFYSRV